jgi:putative bacteriocin precursor
MKKLQKKLNVNVQTVEAYAVSCTCATCSTVQCNTQCYNGAGYNNGYNYTLYLNSYNAQYGH